MIGEAVRAARRRAGLTQAEAAERLGTHVTYWSRVERGVTWPSQAQLERIAAALGCEPHVELRELPG